MTTTSATTPREALRSPMTWLVVAVIGVGAYLFVPFFVSALQLNPVAGILSVAIWGGYALLLWWILARMQRFGRRSWVTTAIAFAWGALGVTGLATKASPGFSDVLTSTFTFGQDSEWASALTAGVVEETLKWAGVLAIAFLPGLRIRSTLDGLYYGLFVGLGFEAAESALYSVSSAAYADSVVWAVIATFVLRGVISGLWSHPTYSAITGAGVGYFVSSPASLARRIGILLGALGLAIASHILFDAPVLEGNAIVATVVKGVPVLVLLLIILRVSRKTRAAQIEAETESATGGPSV
ncbi:PrsW family intramembrane metalloprotease [Demequina sp.]|uniref:PrsW family intramembrane metalloprotease n=1 Tax=Demequina sp. TaxID=2050685 RepID=UPI0025D0F53C|nr:PrsW family intramembrane metalloprotease [Demequina sp.]